jgi:epoxyqueuosine reductase QueG
MKEKLESFIREFIACYNEKPSIETKWDEPVFAYADAKDPMFLKLKDIIGPHHKLPSDFLADGKTVISYFVPLSKTIADSNINGYYASPEWAAAYLATIDLIKAIENGLIHYFDISGWTVAKTADHRSWDPKTMQCDWSHRHAAYIAGLGTFGMNRGLITEKGVCGRIGTLVTDAYIEPTTRPEIEACLAKRNGSCGICIEKCPIQALDAAGNYDNHKCLALTEANAEHHKDIGYADVCGKCMAGMPCSSTRP